MKMIFTINGNLSEHIVFENWTSDETRDRSCPEQFIPWHQKLFGLFVLLWVMSYSFSWDGKETRSMLFGFVLFFTELFGNLVT